MAFPSAYASFLSNFGTLVPISALDDVVNANINLLVLQGGSDVNPARYGATPEYLCQNPNLQLEWFDTNMLPQYIDANIPIFGICRGFQTLNVHFGGQLSQNISQQYSTVNRYELVHELAPMMDLPILKNVKKMKVNSLHHQGFFPAQSGANVVPLLINPIHGNVEAFTVRGHCIAAVQWHPEEIYDWWSSAVINQLLNREPIV